jgi:D-alanine-D-alanine ligase
MSELIETARRAFLALGGNGYGRVDLRLDAGGRPAVIDVNPNPSLDRQGGFAAAARWAGLAYDDLIVLLAREASLKEPHGNPSDCARGPGSAG